MIYTMCDNCTRIRPLDQKEIKRKEFYVNPRGCSEGDYYETMYFFVTCTCGRDIKVSEKSVDDVFSVVKDYTPHRGISDIIGI